MGDTAFSLNHWYYYALSFDAVTLRLYLDGALIQSAATAVSRANLANNTFQVGANTSGNGGFGIYLSNTRFTLGVSRGYVGATIPVPTAPFPIGA